MKITFSLHAGGWQGAAAAPHLGGPVLSPPAFLGLLEVQLGLAGPPTVMARRTAAFLVALRAADAPGGSFTAACRLTRWEPPRHCWPGEMNGFLQAGTVSLARDGQAGSATWPL